MTSSTCTKIYHNTYASFQNELPEMKYFAKHFISMTLVAAIFKILSEQCLSQPPETVAFVASKICQSCITLTLLVGSVNMLYQFTKEEDKQVLKKKSKDILADISRLKQENELFA